jgi:hypothetical protein
MEAAEAARHQRAAWNHDPGGVMLKKSFASLAPKDS